MFINRGNKFGRYLREAIIPGWGSGGEIAADTPSGTIRGVGGRNVAYPIEKTGTSTDYAINWRIGPDLFGNRSRWLELEPHSASAFYRYKKSAGDYGPSLGGTFTVIGIVKCVGDGAHDGNEDPRIYSKDQGTAENDHDLMIGLVTTNNTVPRARIRIGSSTQTLFAADTAANDVGTNQWLLIALTCEADGNGAGNSWVTMTGLHQDGRISTDAASKAGVYNPRNVTAEALWANAAADDNPFHGGILGVWFFNGVVFSTSQLKEFWRNPWQVFGSQRIILPLAKYDPFPIVAESGVTLTSNGTPDLTTLTASGSALRRTVKVTDVNTTETWTDGDTGLPITGTGFL